MFPFEFSRVDKTDTRCKEVLEEIYRLRFKVYCEEWEFEPTENYEDGMESNEYDGVSEHFYIESTDWDRRIIGTARVIMPSNLGYPATKYCIITPEMHTEAIGSASNYVIGEVSRLALSKEYRKRAEDNASAGYDGELPPSNAVEHEKRKADYVFEFYKYLLLQSKYELGLTHWYIAIKRSLYVLLKRVGMVFHPIGPEVDYHGLRTPYLGCLDEIIAGMKAKNPTCFDRVNQ